jgi:hypothetical protein
MISWVKILLSILWLIQLILARIIWVKTAGPCMVLPNLVWFSVSICQIFNILFTIMKFFFLPDINDFQNWCFDVVQNVP